MDSALHDCNEENRHSANRTDQNGETVKQGLNHNVDESADLESLDVTESREINPKQTYDETYREEKESDVPALTGSEVCSENTCKEHNECKCENSNREESHELHSLSTPVPTIAVRDVMPIPVR